MLLSTFYFYNKKHELMKFKLLKYVIYISMFFARQHLLELVYFMCGLIQLITM